jgi:DNA helicase-2/ATP-dependent DNA helicase PcrA
MTDSGLNPAQREAIHTPSGPLLVLAGAGTGKTRVITHRIAELLRRGTAASRILAVTFTNKAAREMKERSTSLLGRRRKDRTRPEISTFHSLCVRILRRHAPELGYPKNFSIYDRGDQESVARAALRDIRVAEQSLRPGDLVGFIGAWKTRALRPEQAADLGGSDREQLAAAAYVRYQAALRAAGALDFDDLLLLTEELFERFPNARIAEATRFDHLLIDEYQDTNALQYRIVKALAGRHRNLCVVGDDDQSIYGWRGAEVAHILGFQRDWPDAKLIRLEDNYRSCAPILKLANTLIAHNGSRHEKTLRASRGDGPLPRFVRFEDEAVEAEAIVREIRQKIDAGPDERVSPSEIAILFRTNEQPRSFEVELRRAKVPYILVGGMSFYDRKEIRDVLAYLKVLANPHDEVSLLRIINTPSRGIAAPQVHALLQRAVSQGRSLWSLLSEAAGDVEVPEHVTERVERFVRLIEGYRAQLGAVTVVDLLRDLLDKVGYRQELARLHEKSGETEARWEAVQELVNAVGLYESRADNPSLLGFLEETTLAARDRLEDPDQRTPHAVTLMTLHSAKGLEFPHVYLVGLEEGLLPHKRTVADSGGRGVEEERRLCYVGVTRAQDALTLSYCKSRMKWGKAQPSIPSRFLMEMRGDTERARRAAEAAAKLFASGAGEAIAGGDAKEKAASTRRSKRRSRVGAPRRQQP